MPGSRASLFALFGADPVQRLTHRCTQCTEAHMASIQRIVSPLTKDVSYRAQVRVKGRAAQSATFPNRKEAEAWAACRAQGRAPAAGADGHREQSWRALLKKPGSPLRTACSAPLGGTAPGSPASRGSLGDWYAHLVRFQGFVASDAILEKRDIRIYN